MKSMAHVGRPAWRNLGPTKALRLLSALIRASGDLLNVLGKPIDVFTILESAWRIFERTVRRGDRVTELNENFTRARANLTYTCHLV